MLVGESATTSIPKPPSLMPNSSECLAEWSYRAGYSHITHFALLLRESKLALISALIEQRAPIDSPVALRVSLPCVITATPIVDSRAIVLTPPKKPGSAQVLPIGAPFAVLSFRSGSVPDRRRFGSSKAIPRRPPLLAASLGVVGLASSSERSDWRVLSVSEKSRNVTADRAWAARVSWGRDETFVFYRSLAPPAPRAFLGHQTTARFLVGRFTSEGVVEPIWKLE